MPNNIAPDYKMTLVLVVVKGEMLPVHIRFMCMFYNKNTVFV